MVETCGANTSVTEKINPVLTSHQPLSSSVLNGPLMCTAHISHHATQAVSEFSVLLEVVLLFS